MRIGGLVIVGRAITEHRGRYPASAYRALREVARKSAAARSSLLVVRHAPAHATAAPPVPAAAGN